MKKTNLLVIAFAVVATGCTAISADERKPGHGMMGNGMMGHGMMMGMEKMDANTDGMLSKDEFMKGHEKVFDMMKNKDGVIAMNDMPKKCMGMMGQGGMMGKHHQMPGHTGKEAK